MSTVQYPNFELIDIACGSGVYLEEAFDFPQKYCVTWYLKNEPEHLVELGNGNYKLPLEEKRIESVTVRRKKELIARVEALISKVYKLEF